MSLLKKINQKASFLKKKKKKQVKFTEGSL